MYPSTAFHRFDNLTFSLKSAEPIYLHIIRPLLKPYTPLLDPLFEVACGLGDLILSLCLFPIYSLVSWWRYAFSSSDADLVSDEEHRTVLDNSAGQHTKVVHRSSSQPAPPSVRRPPAARHASAASSIPTHTSMNGRGNMPDSPRFDSQSSHSVWQPPPPYDSSPEDPSPRPDTFGQTNSFDELPATAPVVDEWRKYPNFPSAYPPTPLPPPNIVLTAASQHVTTSLTTITETTSTHGARLGLPPRMPLNLGFVSGSSDDDDSLGPSGNLDDNQPSYSPTSGDMEDGDEEENDDEDDGDESDDGNGGRDITPEEEDEFDVTLRTPIMPPYGSLKTRLAAHSARESEENFEPGAIDQDSSRNSSASSSSMSVHEISSTSLGQKRSHPADSLDSLRNKASATLKPTSRTQPPRRRTVVKNTAGMIPKSQQQILQGLASESKEAERDDLANDSDRDEPAVHEDKKRKMYETIHGRPTTNSSAKATKAPKRVASTSQLQASSASTVARQTRAMSKTKAGALTSSNSAAGTTLRPRSLRTTSDDPAMKKP
jgi:hypothetical protein